MALRINTNVSSLMAQHQLNAQSASLSKSLERLSSGMRINRAADDAAGAAVTTKLSAEVRGLAQANANAQDAANLLQTADGGLSTITGILQRMRDLAVQAGNDTYTLSNASFTIYDTGGTDTLELPGDPAERLKMRWAVV